MDSEIQKTKFDELVSGISAEERRFLLDKINSGKAPEMIILQSIRDTNDVDFLDTKYKEESFLYRLILWIRSIFEKKSTTSLYNEDLLSNLARKIHKVHPGLIDHKNALIQSIFYSELKELKTAADFFKPYFSIVKDNPGKFYVFLSTFLTPELSEQINKEADPFSVPFEHEANYELRTSLLKKIDNILKNMSSDLRGKLYSAVRSINWLMQFSELPYIHFISQFTAVSSSDYSCSYKNAQTDYPVFAKILHEASSIPKEALQALFLYPFKSSFHSHGLDVDAENALFEFLNKSSTCISMIQMFISTVPVNAMGKLIFSDYEWQCQSSGGGEDWFIKFKEEWKVLFDERWKIWLRERKKAQLAIILDNTFKIDAFPDLPVRPWANLWGGIPFGCEMTAGFLWFFAKNFFPEVMEILNTIILEGIFLNKNNRVELSVAVNDFVDVNHKILTFVDSLEKYGSIGEAFDKIESEHARTLQGQQTVDSIIINSEMLIRNSGQLFCDATRTIEKIFHGILDDEKDHEYESLQNLMLIKGRDNHAFREKMAEVRNILNTARTIFTEIEPLDMPEVKKF